MLVALDEDQVELAAAQPGQGTALLDLLDDDLQLRTGGCQRGQQGQ